MFAYGPHLSSLYLEAALCHPPHHKKYPFSLLFHPLSLIFVSYSLPLSLWGSKSPLCQELGLWVCCIEYRSLHHQHQAVTDKVTRSPFISILRLYFDIFFWYCYCYYKCFSLIFYLLYFVFNLQFM